MAQPYQGVVSYSHVESGGAAHLVDLFDDITVFGDTRSTILILESDDFSVDCEAISHYSV
jgi:hypothetical protein